ncbi:hypothetical protein LTR95_013999 [Oleoguttula sp. CCFEE 5521]
MEACCTTFDPYNVALQAQKEHARRRCRPAHADWRVEWAISLEPCVEAAIEVKRLLILDGSDYDLIWTSESLERTPTSDTFVPPDISLHNEKMFAALVVGQ